MGLCQGKEHTQQWNVGGEKSKMQNVENRVCSKKTFMNIKENKDIQFIAIRFIREMEVKSFRNTSTTGHEERTK